MSLAKVVIGSVSGNERIAARLRELADEIEASKESIADNVVMIRLNRGEGVRTETYGMPMNRWEFIGMLQTVITTKVFAE